MQLLKQEMFMVYMTQDHVTDCHTFC